MECYCAAFIGWSKIEATPEGKMIKASTDQ